jgi:hypothetical protein
MSFVNKIEKLIEENIFRGEKIDNPKIANALKKDYDNGIISNFGSSTLGAWSPPFGLFNVPASGIYQGTRTGHPVAGFFGGKPATLGAASNNIKDIGLGDAFNTTNIVGNLGALAMPVTGLQYGAGKLFGGRMSEEEYAQKLASNGIQPIEQFPDAYKVDQKAKG